ncbi:MAG: C40 family peptidase [Lactobacillales bacterium]|nr:C40 family peptidase [Lactobacillales bacterium]
MTKDKKYFNKTIFIFFAMYLLIHAKVAYADIKQYHFEKGQSIYELKLELKFTEDYLKQLNIFDDENKLVDATQITVDDENHAVQVLSLSNGNSKSFSYMQSDVLSTIIIEDIDCSKKMNSEKFPYFLDPPMAASKVGVGNTFDAWCEMVHLIKKATTPCGVYYYVEGYCANDCEDRACNWVSEEAFYNTLLDRWQMEHNLLIVADSPIYNSYFEGRNTEVVGNTSELASIGEKLHVKAHIRLSGYDFMYEIDYHGQTAYIMANCLDYDTRGIPGSESSVIEKAIDYGMEFNHNSRYAWGGGRCQLTDSGPYDCASFVFQIFAKAGLDWQQLYAQKISELNHWDVAGRKFEEIVPKNEMFRHVVTNNLVCVGESIWSTLLDPRTAERSEILPFKQMLRGDLLFFATVNNSVNHVGIYLGSIGEDNLFLHDSPSANTNGVGINSLQELYWNGDKVWLSCVQRLG